MLPLGTLPLYWQNPLHFCATYWTVYFAKESLQVPLNMVDTSA